MADERDLFAESLADLLARWRRRDQRACKHCGRPNPICDGDLCPERLRHTCAICRAPGIFHKNDCPNRRH